MIMSAQRGARRRPIEADTDVVVQPAARQVNGAAGVPSGETMSPSHSRAPLPARRCDGMTLVFCGH
jgi:hypothetical protein